ncbi:CLUMA_CG016255, isoform A [Clunio marinus]|uniref:CLUMA_CG016255, isoform A n=1 Tax=Clunio marinus TaxID=568069 RepID=A0A1J1IS39_9DIPT|nr:CLUMA_CG016255, isoform A [Clunio marinus]
MMESESSEQQDDDMFEDARENVSDSYESTSISSRPMDLNQALLESKVAIDYFFNNKFEEARQLMRTNSDSSIYHAVGHSVFLFLEAILTFEQQHIESAVVAIKQSIEICNKYRRKTTMSEYIGKPFRKAKFESFTEIEAHAELCSAEALLLKALLTFIEDESFSSMIKGGIKIKACFNSYNNQEGDLVLCEQMLKEQLDLFPNGVWFLFFKGRLEFMKGNLDEALLWYNRSLNSQNTWIQFHHICFWEMLWVHTLKLNWRKASFFANSLVKCSKWSRTMYSYQEASLLCMIDEKELTAMEKTAIEKLLHEVPKHKQRIAGKSLPMEKFACKRAERYFLTGRLIIPAIELMFLWNFFKICGKHFHVADGILKIIEKTLKSIEQRADDYVTDNTALLLLLKGSCLRHMNNPLQALNLVLFDLVTNFTKMIRLLLVAAVLTTASCQFQPIVTTSSGQLRGSRVFIGLFDSYFSFKGIPYAQPPVGELRFRNPVPVVPWTGVRDASNHGDFCPNGEVFGNSIGHEDCLFLNVYTPNLNGNLPVMMWIHGGAFIIGDGNTLVYGPDLLVEEDVIVVTLNYRLAALGFLNTGDKNAQGNYGLKDIVLAIKWVRDNIGAFGGDPEQITLFGQSAGSVSINMLLLSEMSRGLFKQGIMQSGTALAPFTLRNNGVDLAEQIGNKLGLTFDSTESLMTQLRQVPYQDILSASRNIVGMDKPLGLRPFDFVPCVEPEDSLEERFLTDDPINILISQNYETVPLMIGTTSNEGLLQVRESLIDSDVFQRYNENPDFFVPLSYKLDKDSPETIEVADEFKNIYFNNEPLSNSNLVGWAKFHTDAQFKFPTDRTLQYFMQTSTHPIYYYEFSYSGTLNFLKQLLFLFDYDGACHADDMFYLFKPSFPIPMFPWDQAIQVRRRQVRLWANFAKFGNPTPTTDNLVNTIWPVYDEASKAYLEMGKDLSIKYDQPRLKPWHDYQMRFTGHI